MLDNTKTEFKAKNWLSDNRVSVAGNCRNQAFLEIPRQLRKTQAFPEMPRQLRKFDIFSYLSKNTSILGNNTPLKS